MERTELTIVRALSAKISINIEAKNESTPSVTRSILLSNKEIASDGELAIMNFY